MTKIIGFTGKKQVGKSTASDILESFYPGAVRISFKSALLEEIKEYFPDVLKHYGDDPDKVLEFKPGVIRQLLQNFGTEFRRKQDDRYWIKKWVERLETADAPLVIVDDVRFQNEADVIREWGGIIIKLHGNTAQAGDAHVSEVEMDKIKPDYMMEVEKGNLQKMIYDLNLVDEYMETA